MKKGRGILLNFDKEVTITGYLVIGTAHFEIYGQRVSDIRTELFVRETGDTAKQGDLFDEQSGEASA